MASMKQQAEIVGGPLDGAVIDYIGPAIVHTGDGFRKADPSAPGVHYFAKRSPDLSGPTVGRRYVYAPMVLRSKI